MTDQLIGMIRGDDSAMEVLAAKKGADLCSAEIEALSYVNWLERVCELGPADPGTVARVLVCGEESLAEKTENVCRDLLARGVLGFSDLVPNPPNLLVLTQRAKKAVFQIQDDPVANCEATKRYYELKAKLKTAATRMIKTDDFKTAEEILVTFNEKRNPDGACVLLVSLLRRCRPHQLRRVVYLVKEFMPPRSPAIHAHVANEVYASGGCRCKDLFVISECLRKDRPKRTRRRRDRGQDGIPL